MPLRRLAGWWLLAAGFLCAGALGRASRELDDPVLALSLGAAAIELLILALSVALALLLPGPARARLGLVRPGSSGREIALLVAGTLGLSHALDAGLVWSGLYPQTELATFANLMRGARGFPLAAAAFAVGVLAPLAEELLCRGVIQRSLVPRLGRVGGVGLAALAFGTLHIEPIHAVLAAVLGLYLGIAGLWAGSVLVPIACHVVNNAFALGMAVHGGASAGGAPEHVGIGLAIAAASLFLAHRNSLARLQKEAGSDDG